ncbi:MAG TPA: hypothetical protein VFN44_23685 [Solirubrobacteraceae bacterium]|nr:hypothetical protein [Solirubrobacteraceae bacterium]
MLVVAAALVPAAIAWACNPQAHISLNGTSFSPGQSITVYGSYFATNANVTVSGAGNAPVTVKTSGGGGFTVSGFTAPSTPGSYTITATRPTGGFAPVSFQVVAPAQANPPVTTGTGTQPSGSSAPAEQQAQAPSRSFETPAVAKSEREPATSRERSSNGNRSPGSEPTQTTAPAAPAQPVFSGSTAPATSTTTFATQPSTTGAAAPARTRGNARERSAGSGRATTPAAAGPSQQTAFSDVWSGFQPGRTASLTSAGAGAPDNGPGSQLAWGIGLLALGVFGLVGGLAYTEARRRRVA